MILYKSLDKMINKIILRFRKFFMISKFFLNYQCNIIYICVTNFGNNLLLKYYWKEKKIFDNNEISSKNLFLVKINRVDINI